MSWVQDAILPTETSFIKSMKIQEVKCPAVCALTPGIAINHWQAELPKHPQSAEIWDRVSAADLLC